MIKSVSSLNNPCTDSCFIAVGFLYTPLPMYWFLKSIAFCILAFGIPNFESDSSHTLKVVIHSLLSFIYDNSEINIPI